MSSYDDIISATSGAFDPPGWPTEESMDVVEKKFEEAATPQDAQRAYADLSDKTTHKGNKVPELVTGMFPANASEKDLSDRTRLLSSFAKNLTAEQLVDLDKKILEHRPPLSDREKTELVQLVMSGADANKAQDFFRLLNGGSNERVVGTRLRELVRELVWPDRKDPTDADREGFNAFIANAMNKLTDNQSTLLENLFERSFQAEVSRGPQYENRIENQAAKAAGQTHREWSMSQIKGTAKWVESNNTVELTMAGDDTLWRAGSAFATSPDHYPAIWEKGKKDELLEPWALRPGMTVVVKAPHFVKGMMDLVGKAAEKPEAPKAEDEAPNPYIKPEPKPDAQPDAQPDQVFKVKPLPASATTPAENANGAGSAPRGALGSGRVNFGTGFGRADHPLSPGNAARTLEGAKPINFGSGFVVPVSGSKGALTPTSNEQGAQVPASKMTKQELFDDVMDTPERKKERETHQYAPINHK